MSYLKWYIHDYVLYIYRQPSIQFLLCHKCKYFIALLCHQQNHKQSLSKTFRYRYFVLTLQAIQILRGSNRGTTNVQNCILLKFMFCNIILCSFSVLFLSVVLFTVTAIFILTDNRRHLISAIQLYHPSFLYAYIAIPAQAGVVQVR